MHLIDCEIDFILICSATDSTGAGTFKVTDTKLYVLVVNLSTQDNLNLLKKFKSWFNGTINGNIYEPKASTETLNQYFDFLIDPRFEGVNILFVLAYENGSERTVSRPCLFPKLQIKDFNVMIDVRKFFNQPIQIYIKTYDNIKKSFYWSRRWLQF